MARKFPKRSVFEVGSLPPKGYVAWHEWAAVQHRGGLRQKQCKCGKWLYPQEVEGHKCKTEEKSNVS